MQEISSTFTHDAAGKLYPRTKWNWVGLMSGAMSVYERGEKPLLQTHAHRYLERFPAYRLYEWAQEAKLGRYRKAILGELMRVFQEANQLDGPVDTHEWESAFGEALAKKDIYARVTAFIDLKTPPDRPLSFEVEGRLVGCDWQIEDIAPGSDPVNDPDTYMVTVFVPMAALKAGIAGSSLHLG